MEEEESWCRWLLHANAQILNLLLLEEVEEEILLTVCEALTHTASLHAVCMWVCVVWRIALTSGSSSSPEKSLSFLSSLIHFCVSRSISISRSETLSLLSFASSITERRVVLFTMLLRTEKKNPASRWKEMDEGSDSWTTMSLMFSNCGEDCVQQSSNDSWNQHHHHRQHQCLCHRKQRDQLRTTRTERMMHNPLIVRFLPLVSTSCSCLQLVLLLLLLLLHSSIICVDSSPLSQQPENGMSSRLLLQISSSISSSLLLCIFELRILCASL